jgi:DNA-binding SARP family transcriptional activator
VLEIGVLGAVEAWSDGVPIDLGGPQRRAILAVLVLARGRAVTVDNLVDSLWPDDPPASARPTMHSQVSRLRKSLCDVVPEVLRGDGGAYRLGRDPAVVAIDADRFEALVDEAKRHVVADPSRALELLGDAERCWRGDVACDLPERGFALGHAARLHELRREATLHAARLRFGAGDLHRLLVDLAPAVQRDPLDEALRSVEVAALHRAGRRATALRTLADIRRRLVDELGADPGAALSEIEMAILRDDDDALDRLVCGERKVVAPAAPSPTATERYALDRPIGVDSDVWLAHDQVIGRDVVLTFGPLAPAEERARTLRAASALGRLTAHHAVLGVLDVGDDGDRVFLVSELVDGSSLADALARPGEAGVATPSLGRALADVVEAVAHLHREGVAHGGLTPGRVLLRPDDRAVVGGIGRALVRGDLAGDVDGDRAALAALLDACSARFPLAARFAHEVAAGADLDAVAGELAGTTCS